MKFRWTYLLVVLFLALGAWLTAACGGGEEEEEVVPPAPTAAEGEEEGVTAPAAAFAELESYRYVIRFKIEGGEPEAATFAIDIEGAFVAPDRSQVKVSGDLGGLAVEEESITIGGRSWVKVDGDWEEGVPSFATSDFSPASFLQGFDAQELRALKADKETVNGVPSLRYKIGRANIEQIANLGPILGGEAALEDLPENFDIDMWLAEDGRWPVRLVMSASGEVDGGEIDFEFSLDVTDVNDKSIQIEPPT